MLRRALPRPTSFWASQGNVIGSLLRARASAHGIHGQEHGRHLPRLSSSVSYQSSAFRTQSPSRSPPPSPILAILVQRRTLIPPTRVAVRVQVRAFHASHSQRHPAPAVIFAAGALLKSTGAWAAFTILSRILFTLIPVSLMASRKISAKHAKYAKSYAPTDISPGVRKYFHTFCEGEACRRPRRTDMFRTAKERDPEGMSALSRGKVVYCPSPSADRKAVFQTVYKDTVNVSRQRTGLEPLPDDEIHYPETRHSMWVTPFFYLPELTSPAARRALEKMSTEEKEQLFELRCHEAHKEAIADKVKRINKLFVCFVVLPFMVFAATAILSLERTPYSGRWRFIMLSPEAEDDIAQRLRGPGWYQTVISLLTTPEAPAPPIVPTDDWRWHWVNSVLRRLESGVLAECSNNWSGDTIAGQGYAIPPPPEHPLHPRPRAACFIHAAVPGSQASDKTGSEHLAVGPPYSLLLLRDEERNALSMGWGSDGAGGVVVYTGILDEILADSAPTATAPPEPTSTSTSWFHSIFGAPHRSRVEPRQQVAMPTEEQTIRLACVLAHELAHLLLAHHLEALSASQVLVPNVTGLASDLIRTMIFPVTMILGPFVNDFISQISKAGMDQSKVLSDICFSRHQEREADLVSLRLLAYAGYDPETAIKYWEHTPKALCGKDPLPPSSEDAPHDPRPLTFFRGVTHDSDEERLEALMREIERWKVYAELRRDGKGEHGVARWAKGLVGRVWA